MHQRARTDLGGGRGETRVPTATHGNADLVVLTERRAPPSASYWKEPSQSQCAGAYTAAVGLVAKSHGAGRTRGTTFFAIKSRRLLVSLKQRHIARA
jgi:hypothetical protein